MKRFSLSFLFTILALPALAGGGNATIQRAEKAASSLMESRMKNERPEDLKLLKTTTKKDIIVVAGSMDHIEKILSSAGIPFELVQPQHVARFDLNANQIVMVNCPGVMPQASVQRIKRFVTAGGTLYTTDWTLKNLVEPAFPKTIKHNGKETGDHVTSVSIKKKGNDMMSQMLLRKDGKPQWWLEGGSYPITIVNKRKVQVLAESAEMKRLYGSAPVVVKFRWEDGEVIHVVSHFARQVSAKSDGVSTNAASGGISGLSDEERKKMNAESGDLPMAEVESSYAFQQMTSNVVVSKKRSLKDLDKKFTHESTGDLTINGRPVKKGERLKVLKKKKKKVKVRDDRGNESWVDVKSLQKR